jgi:WhiB family redox-sensing transcriptional regulator
MTLIKITPDYLQHQQYVNASIASWKDESACLSTSTTEDFFDTKESALRALSKKYCQDCPVQFYCLYTSLVNQEAYGLWGGLTPKQRKSYFKHILNVAVQQGLDPKNWSKELDALLRKYSDPEQLVRVTN